MTRSHDHNSVYSCIENSGVLNRTIFCFRSKFIFVGRIHYEMAISNKTENTRNFYCNVQCLELLK